MAQKIIRSLEKKNALPEVLILKAMQMLVSSQNAVFTKTIVNCFRKAEICNVNQETAVANEDDPFKHCIMRLMLYEIFDQILCQKMSTHFINLC